LLNFKKIELTDIEKRCQTSIYIIGYENLKNETYEIEISKAEEELNKTKDGV